MPADRLCRCASCGCRLRSGDRTDRTYCSGKCRMRAMRARRAPDPQLQALSQAIERFLEGRVLRGGTVAARTPVDLLDSNLEGILAMAIDLMKDPTAQESDK